MNYYSATQRLDGRWDYVCHNRRSGAHAVGYCMSPKFIREMLDDTQSVYPWSQQERDIYEADLAAGKYHDTGHATAEEAAACYRLYEIEKQTRYGQETNTQRKCRYKNCGNWTSHFAEVGHSQLFHLCDEHRNQSCLEELLPMVSERWSSY